MCIHTLSIMTTKTLNVREEAYLALKARKRPDESFSDTILRLLGKDKKDLLTFLNKLSNQDRSSLAEAAQNAKKELELLHPREVSL